MFYTLNINTSTAVHRRQQQQRHQNSVIDVEVPQIEWEGSSFLRMDASRCELWQVSDDPLLSDFFLIRSYLPTYLAPSSSNCNRVHKTRTNTGVASLYA